MRLVLETWRYTQYCSCWWSGGTKCHGISIHCLDLILRTRPRVNTDRLVHWSWKKCANSLTMRIANKSISVWWTWSCLTYFAVAVGNIGVYDWSRHRLDGMTHKQNQDWLTPNEVLPCLEASNCVSVTYRIISNYKSVDSKDLSSQSLLQWSTSLFLIHHLGMAVGACDICWQSSRLALLVHHWWKYRKMYRLPWIAIIWSWGVRGFF